MKKEKEKGKQGRRGEVRRRKGKGEEKQEKEI